MAKRLYLAKVCLSSGENSEFYNNYVLPIRLRHPSREKEIYREVCRQLLKDENVASDITVVRLDIRTCVNASKDAYIPMSYRWEDFFNRIESKKAEKMNLITERLAVKENALHFLETAHMKHYRQMKRIFGKKKERFNGYWDFCTKYTLGENLIPF